MNKLKFLKFNETDRIWIFSDPHFGHKNIAIGTSNWEGESRKGCRDFANPDIMDATIINNINEKVGYDDTLICLGDWTFAGEGKVAEYRSRIVCKNLHLVLGNHDKPIRDSLSHQAHFTTVRDYLEMNVGEHHVVMTHYPIESWNRMHRGSFHLFGHQHLPKHLKLKNGKKLDVGLDGNDFEPYSWSEIYNLLKDRAIVTDFHHKERKVTES